VVTSEKERKREEEEARVLAEAKPERGRIVTWKGEYGFLRSTSRDQDIFFHVSNVMDRDDELGDEDAVAAGQEVEFLVARERRADDDKVSARRITRLPEGSVEFEIAVARAVTGVVIKLPARGAGGKPGTVRLRAPLVHEGEELRELRFFSQDSPGGTFAVSKFGDQFGFWVKEGDTLLFDVFKDLLYHNYRLAGTAALCADADADVNPNADADAKPNPNPAEKHHSSKAHSVKLVCTLVGRFEGVVTAVKTGGYGFIECAERNTNAYFRLYQVLPESLQADLRRNMHGIDIKPGENKITAGTEVSFDLTLVMEKREGPANNKQRKKNQEEKANLRANRICILPRGSVFSEKTLARNVTATVKYEHNNGGGVLELAEEVKGMDLEERHPLITRTLKSFVAHTTVNAITLPDVLSFADGQLYQSMASRRGLDATFSRVESDASEDVEGDSTRRLLISKSASPSVEQTTRRETHERSEDDVPPSSIRSEKKPNDRIELVKVINFSPAASPPGLPLVVGDVVVCDVVQSRRTGACTAANLDCVERKAIPRGKNSSKKHLRDKHTCEGLVLIEPSYTTFSNAASRIATNPLPKSTDAEPPGRWDNLKDAGKKKSSSGQAGGRVLLLSDPKETADAIANNHSEVKSSNEEDGAKPIVSTHLAYNNEAGPKNGEPPRRGDLVSFFKSYGVAKDVKLIQKSAGNLVKGRLRGIDKTNGFATFVPSPDFCGPASFHLKSSEVVGCAFDFLKDNESVEGVVHQGRLYGVCRLSNLYLETKMGKRTERPRLNLAVRKGAGGKIIAQSCMAKVSA